MPQTIPENPVFINNALGNHVYVWTKVKDKPSHKHAIITAHGKTATSIPKTVSRNIDLRFYCEQNYIQGGVADLRIAVEGRFQPRELTTVNDLTKDYELSKYQGKHQSATSTDEAGENYAYIAKWMHDLDTYYRDILGITSKTTRDQWLSNFKGEVQMDVITLRNRVFGEAPKLTELVKLLEDKGYNYDVIHCSHCRGRADGTNAGQQEPIITQTSIFD